MADEDPITNPLPPDQQPGPLTPEHQTPQVPYEETAEGQAAAEAAGEAAPAPAPKRSAAKE